MRVRRLPWIRCSTRPIFRSFLYVEVEMKPSGENRRSLTIGSGKLAATQGYVCFLQFGFGLETRVGNTRIGLTAPGVK